LQFVQIIINKFRVRCKVIIQFVQNSFAVKACFDYVEKPRKRKNAETREQQNTNEQANCRFSRNLQNLISSSFSLCRPPARRLTRGLERLKERGKQSCVYCTAKVQA
jgi:hypothetical protein